MLNIIELSKYPDYISIMDKFSKFLVDENIIKKSSAADKSDIDMITPENKKILKKLGEIYGFKCNF
ncbi:hypothetical protein AHEV_245 [Adoxophyes honmai entomopoxvirus 'L']|uniref:Uncharacterized protein n=1 Tax=Adoxophyes honmai entomopoxvirus 'L' TaxID=1293540 RepID=A0A916KPC4_9POXV|nr:hypothetical protein AHEV_003 [Adoxophyes honmai entomopoxvirus 'L']YP_008004068.1 hypothetical protein AHEV_245 [Adoxophyes honmai entomopoxvirus 'L']CCU55324.1 hypothetical protein AHEV_003 [Adoxophyes honmai entomopoxvirus 'L']CCU55566.1 hypothetical protein AHEV_245 [Adoxophyes honmai entomopoxvirus 'L']